MDDRIREMELKIAELEGTVEGIKVLLEALTTVLKDLLERANEGEK